MKEKTIKLYGLFVICGAILLSGSWFTVAYGQDPGAADAKSVSQPAQETAPVGSTLDNLQTAYVGENNESVRYAAFAVKADEEGFGPLASLFRAVGRGEAIHAANHAAVIRQMGGTPKPDDETPLVLSTRENLESADANQHYEKDVMYPEFVKQAHKEKNKAAEESFRFAMEAEPAHHVLFQQALKDLSGYKGENVDFYVCPKCGYSARPLNSEACPVCSTPRDQFEQIR